MTPHHISPIVYSQIDQRVKNWRATWGQQIQTVRRNKNMTQKQLSRLTRISLERLDKIEIGKGACDLHLLARITNVLGMDITLLSY